MMRRRSGKPRVCLIRQHYVPRDTRVARQVAELARCGFEVDVLCLQNRGEPRVEQKGRVTIRRVPLRHTRKGSPGWYLAEYATFFVLATCYLTMLHLRRRYRLIQINSLPDVLVFAAAVPRLLGTRILLDLQECMPEFFVTKFGTDLEHPAVRLIARVEQLAIRFAHLVITPTEHMKSTFVARGAQEGKISVVMDGADEDVFRQTSTDSDRRSKHFTLVSHGTLEEHYGLDTVIRAVAKLRDEIPQLRFEVYGDGSHLPQLRELAAELKVEDRVVFSDGFVPIDVLVRAIATADIGVVAMKRDPFRDVTLASKMFDFIAMQRPVIVSRTKSVEESFGPSCFQFFESGDVDDLAVAIRALHADPRKRRDLVERATEAAKPYSWSRQREVYRRAVECLTTAEADPRP